MSRLLPRSTPSKEGIEAKAILDMLRELDEQRLEYHSVMIIRHGKVIAEGWKSPYSPTLPHTLYSLSKSFTSAAAGFAAEEGLIDFEDSVISYFGDKIVGGVCENMQKMKIKHLLTMSTGHAAEPKFTNYDFSGTFIRSYVDFEPGTKFVYNTAATYMLSEIIQRASGKSVFDYLTPRLFEPLGIENIRWKATPDGVNTGGWGLNLKTEDIAKFGVMLINGGIYDDKRIISREWAKSATGKQIDNSNGSGPTDDWSSGYGYQFWRCSHEDMYRGDGMFGQLCCVMPKEDIVFAATAAVGNVGALLDTIRRNLLKGLRGATFDDDKDTEHELFETLSALSLPFPNGDDNISAFGACSGVYAVSKNSMNIKKVGFEFNTPPAITIYTADKSFRLPLGYKSFIEGDIEIPLEGEIYGEVGDVSSQAAAAYGVSGKTLNVKLIFNTSPFTDNLEVRFKNDALDIMITRNVAFGRPQEERIIGIREG